jgi:hypothetical protein
MINKSSPPLFIIIYYLLLICFKIHLHKNISGGDDDDLFWMCERIPFGCNSL